MKQHRTIHSKVLDALLTPVNRDEMPLAELKLAFHQTFLMMKGAA